MEGSLKELAKQLYRSYMGERINMNRPVWSVKDVEPHSDYTLLLTFAGGEKRIYDAKPLLEKKLYQPLKNLAFFMSAKAMYGTVVWSDDLDIAPEHLYECSIPAEAVASK